MPKDENKKSSETLATAARADVFSSIREEIDDATKSKKDGVVGRKLEAAIESGEPVQNLEAYIRDQLGRKEEPSTVRGVNAAVNERILNNRSVQRMGSAGSMSPAPISVGGDQAQGSSRFNMPIVSNTASGEDAGSDSETGGEEGEERAPRRMPRAVSSTVADRGRREGKMPASPQGGGRQLSDLDKFLLFVIFVVSVGTDILDLIIDATGVGAFFAPIISIMTATILTILWWVVGGEYRMKNLKNNGVAMLIESIPFVDMLPTNTVAFFRSLAVMLHGNNSNASSVARKVLS